MGNLGCRAVALSLALVSAVSIATGGAHAAPGPSDPLVAQQQPLTILKIAEAMGLLGRPLQDVLVATPDTGLDLDHPDFASRLFTLGAATQVGNPDNAAAPNTVPAGAHGWDFIGTNEPGALQPDSDPSDPAGRSSHGTVVAGVLGAAWNQQGSAGVAPNARFVALRTCWDGDNCYQYLQDEAFTWAAERGVRVVSLSWLTGPIDAALAGAIRDASNTLFVTIPSGNGAAFDADPTNPLPCNLDAPNVLCVSTSAPDDGLDCGAYGATTVDVAVPTQANQTTSNGGGWGPTGCATSYASPTAAGVATILFGLDPTAQPADVKAAIVDSARRVPAWSGKSVSGGIVDAAAAVRLFQQRRGIAQPPPPPPPLPPPLPPPPPQTTVLLARSSGAAQTRRVKRGAQASVRVRFVVTQSARLVPRLVLSPPRGASVIRKLGGRDFVGGAEKLIRAKLKIPRNARAGLWRLRATLIDPVNGATVGRTGTLARIRVLTARTRR